MQATQSPALRAIYIQEYKDGGNALFSKAKTTEQVLAKLEVRSGLKARRYSSDSCGKRPNWSERATSREGRAANPQPTSIPSVLARATAASWDS